MSGDIGPGDVVQCVDATPTLRPDCPLRLGRVYRVRGIAKRTGGLLLYGVTSIAERWGAGFALSRFRKLNDGTDDAELIARIKSAKPIRTPEPVSQAGHSLPAEGGSPFPAVALTYSNGGA